MIELKNISKEFTLNGKTNTLYKDLNFTIKKGDFIAINDRFQKN